MSSMDHSEDKFRNNYLIFNPNYFIFKIKKKLLPFLNNFLINYLSAFLITISILLLSHSLSLFLFCF
jgi:hypothetical protein